MATARKGGKGNSLGIFIIMILGVYDLGAG